MSAEKGPQFPKPPETFISIDSSTAEIEEKKVKFFLEVAEYLGYTQNAAVFLQVMEREFLVEQFSDGRKPNFSNDSITMLVLKGERLLASVLRWRTDNNFTQVSFNLHFTPEQMEKFRFRLPSEDPHT